MSRITGRGVKCVCEESRIQYVKGRGTSGRCVGTGFWGGAGRGCRCVGTGRGRGYLLSLCYWQIGRSLTDMIAKHRFKSFQKVSCRLHNTLIAVETDPTSRCTQIHSKIYIADFRRSRPLSLYWIKLIGCRKIDASFYHTCRVLFGSTPHTCSLQHSF